MAKKATGSVKLQIAAGKATPAPPVGPALGQAQINIMEFCKQFNARTGAKELEGLDHSRRGDGVQRPLVHLHHQDAAGFDSAQARGGIAKGSGAPNKDKVGKVTAKQVEDIAQQKMPDLNAASVESAMKSVRGTARSMGIEVVG